MTDYNDGKIHGWNGGDCPVHPETVVDVWLRNGIIEEIRAAVLLWKHKNNGGDIIAFQVVKQFVEPARPAALKVIWVNEYADGCHVAHDTEAKARRVDGLHHTQRIAVKYVEVKE